ncbi:MAG: hypothetical protein AB1744_10200 [Candidatus Zixiibacteriota bacterium]
MKRTFYILTALVFVAGAAYWVSDLTSDPPMYYAGLGQSLATDPPQYVHHARNRILFDEFDPFDYPRWTVYRYSLTSLLAYVVFSLGGVGLVQAGLAGVLLSLGGLAFLILGLLRQHRPWVAAAVAFCFVINVTLLTHGRLPYLENGLLFLSALVFFVYSWWGDRLWGAAVAGGVIALAMLAGKLFGALLLPALLLAIIMSDGTGRRRRAAAAIGSFAVVSFIYVFLVYGQNLGAAAGYIGEQTYGLRGIPEGLTSPWRFVEHLISYGYQNRLFYLDADVLLFLAPGISLLALYRSAGGRLGSVSRAAIFAMSWLLFSFVGLAPLAYSPIRYTLLIIPSILLFCFTIFDSQLGLKKKTPERPDWFEVSLFTLAFWLLLFHVVADLFYFNVQSPPIRRMTWFTLPAAVGLALTLRYLISRGALKVTHRSLLIALTGILLASAVVNTARIRRLHILDHNFNIAEANADLPRILNPGAVVSGPYGPALTVNNQLRSFIHFFMVAEVDSTLFDRQPVTHLAVDESNWREAVKNYPRLRQLQPLGHYWIRDVQVTLYRVNHLFSNPEARAYQLTEYEQAVSYLQSGRHDSALAMAQMFHDRHPRSKLGGLLLSDLLWRNGRYDQSYRILSSLASLYPTDFNVQLLLGRLLLAAAEQNNDPGLHHLAQTYFKRAVDVNRYKAAYAKQVWDQTIELSRRRQNLPGP